MDIFGNAERKERMRIVSRDMQGRIAGSKKVADRGTPPLVSNGWKKGNKIPSVDQQVEVQPPGGYGTFFFQLTQDNFAIAYTDGFSDRSLSNGGAGIILLLPDGINYKHKINTGIIASNFTSELVAIREALILYQQDPHVIDSTEGLVIFSDSKSAIEAIRNGETNISCDIITLLEQLHNKRKSCILQWIPAHVNIEGNECADIYSLAKEARDIEHKCTTITLDDANAVAKHRIMNHIFKKPLATEFECPRIITSTIARLRTEHLKSMKIHPDKTRSYV
ncbi:RNase H domain-containing protein [Trichonephila clavipes]|nr:RNase H domain-containing protein [Trichonephila clavipes]